MKENAVSEKEEGKNPRINDKLKRSQDRYASESRDIGRSDNLFGRAELAGEVPTLDQQKTRATAISPSQVIEALARSPEVDAAHVHVMINEGTVTLKGTARDEKEIRAMIRIVENLPHVNKVQSMLKPLDPQRVH